MKYRSIVLTLLLFSFHVVGMSESVQLVDLGSGKAVGHISFEQTPYGVVFKPFLHELPPGVHGFHVHENPSCASSQKNGHLVLGGKAGSHYDPLMTRKHGNPWDNNSHLGDLPALYVDKNGRALQPVLAPRLKLSDLFDRSLMVHAGGDNHSDHPAKLGGGGARIACGVITER
ncbi:superoxide dismutase [Alteromonadaceae bacterium M269]|nr:superoxide dismutase [Alteromonadaceae bacterium M269]